MCFNYLGKQSKRRDIFGKTKQNKQYENKNRNDWEQRLDNNGMTCTSNFETKI